MAVFIRLFGSPSKRKGVKWWLLGGWLVESAEADATE